MPAGLLVALLMMSSLLGGQAWAAPFDCKEAPEPDRPGSGLVGSLDPAVNAGAPGSVYNEVGYSGLVWHTYDLGCGGSVSDPSVATDTWLGNQTFNIAKFIVGGVNWAHYLLARGGEVLTPLDKVIEQGTKAMYDGVFSTLIGPALLLLALALLMLALRGDLARQAQRAGFALLALMLGAAAYLAPVNWAKAADGLLLDGITQMQEGFLSPLGRGDVNTLPTVLTDRVIYDNWLRGEFGAPNDPKAVELGRELLRTQTFTNDDVYQGKITQADVDAKKKAFADVAGKMGERYPYFQGKSGSRIGVSVLAVIQAVCIGLFQLLSKVLVLVAMLLLRLLVMTLPVIAVLGVLKPEVLPMVAKVAGSALVNTLLVGALAGLHALLVVSLFKPDSGVDLWLSLLVTGVTTVVLWAVARPLRRLVSMVSLTREQFGGVVPGAGDGPVSRMWNRLRGAQPDERQQRWWDERRAEASGPAEPSAHRPESVYASASVVSEQRYAGGWRPGQREVGTPESAQLGPAPDRRALTAGGFGGIGGLGGFPSGLNGPDAVEMDERVIYRRPGARTDPYADRDQPVQAELVDGVPVYRIYRPRPSQPSYPYRGGD
ncbi:hypothetical protein GCM10023321_65800 [Pseudonocardia eucalypti]|uniref:TrbL/VirB6 plasmid conjugal transfer protein n=1 Tax=Pseudonocardia eucalypti TaxID=648755 RepID=A0ABP9R031_9PSEU|nr:hypothetical protein [Pseudonocardia eucalypti]